MFDNSRRKERLSRDEILRDMKPNDLIAINDGDGIVHIVFPGTGTICRRKMLEVGTYSSQERTWNILGSTDFGSYKKVVTDELKMRPCGHCLLWYR